MRRVTYSILTIVILIGMSAVQGSPTNVLPSKILVLKTWTPPALEGVRRCPVCGAMIPAESDRESDGAKVLDTLLSQKLASINSCDFIYPQSDEDALLSLSQSAEREKLKELSAKYDVPAVLYPVLLRYRERVGNKYAVSSPSAVAFHIYVLKPENFEVLWRAYYIEEQQPLSSNLLKVRLMWKRKFQWVSAQDLLNDGLELAFKKFPSCGGDAR